LVLNFGLDLNLPKLDWGLVWSSGLRLNRTISPVQGLGWALTWQNHSELVQTPNQKVQPPVDIDNLTSTLNYNIMQSTMLRSLLHNTPCRRVPPAVNVTQHCPWDVWHAVGVHARLVIGLGSCAVGSMPVWCVHPRGVWQGSAFIAGAMVCLIFFTSWRDSGA
jgi:hypothetical protein